MVAKGISMISDLGVIIGVKNFPCRTNKDLSTKNNILQYNIYTLNIYTFTMFSLRHILRPSLLRHLFCLQLALALNFLIHAYTIHLVVLRYFLISAWTVKKFRHALDLAPIRPGAY